MSLNGTSELSEPVAGLIGKLRKRGAKTVALQFPEGLKRKAAGVAAALREAGFEVIVSGDPCYGACDLALGMLEYADVLVHFGHAPVDERQDVICEPYPVGFDITVLEKAIPLLGGARAGLVTTVQHAHLVPVMEAFLKAHGVAVEVAGGSGRTPLPGQVLGCRFEAAKIPGADIILFVGTGRFHPTGIALATGKRVIALDPLASTAGEVTAEALLRRRFAAIEKARKASTIGILVSSKSGQNRIRLARQLAGLGGPGGNAVLVMMCEVSPGELLNLGFGAYVNTACPRLAYDDQVRFPVPVLSPPEYEILRGVRSWDEYTIDEI